MDLDLYIYHQGQNMGTHPVHRDAQGQHTLCDGPYWLHDKIGEPACNAAIERIFATLDANPATHGDRFDDIMWRILPSGMDDQPAETA